MKENKLKVAIYCRVGTENNEKIKEQEEYLKKVCELFQYTIFKVYKDNGYSGRDNNRQDYQLMINDLKNKRFNTIFTISIDRISRDISDLELFLKLIEKHHCYFKSIKDNIDLDTAFGKMFARIITIMGTFGDDLER